MRQISHNNFLGRARRSTVRFASMAVLAGSLSNCTGTRQAEPHYYPCHAIPAEDFRKMLERAGEVTSKLGITDEKVVREFAFGFSMIGEEKAVALHKQLGIEYFTRYSKEALDETYKNYVLGEKNKKPVLLVVFNKNDWNGAFHNKKENIDQLLKGYRLVISETSDEGGLYSAIGNTAGRAGKIDTLIIGGHGTMAEVNLGKGNYEGSNIDISDEDELKKMRENFIKSPMVVLFSCSTGKYEDFTVGAMISNALSATVIAPEVDSATREFILDSNGRIQDMLRSEGKTRKYVAGRKQDSILYDAIWPRGHCIDLASYQKAAEATRKKCKGDVSCIMHEFRAGYDDEFSPFYKESFSGLGEAGDTVARFPNEAVGMSEMKIESIDDKGVVFVASGKVLNHEMHQSGVMVVNGFKEQVDRFRVDYGEESRYDARFSIDDFSFVGSGDLGVWGTIRQYLHLKSFSIEKTSQEGVVKISVHRQRFCDVKYDWNY